MMVLNSNDLGLRSTSDGFGIEVMTFERWSGASLVVTDDVARTGFPEESHEVVSRCRPGVASPGSGTSSKLTAPVALGAEVATL